MPVFSYIFPRVYVSQSTAVVEEYSKLSSGRISASISSSVKQYVLLYAEAPCATEISCTLFQMFKIRLYILMLSGLVRLLLGSFYSDGSYRIFDTFNEGVRFISAGSIRTCLKKSYIPQPRVLCRARLASVIAYRYHTGATVR